MLRRAPPRGKSHARPGTALGPAGGSFPGGAHWGTLCGMGEAARSAAGKTALVTGAARRLGRAIALALADEGCGVVVHYRRSAEAARQTAADIEARGGRAWCVQADLGVLAAAEALLPRAAELAAGPVDVLVNSAAVFPDDRVTDFGWDALAGCVVTNAMAPLVLSRALAAQGRQGSIVNLLDARMVDYDARHASYHLSKRMLLSLTRMTALEFAPSIRVNAVAPGLILPPPGQDEGYLQKLASTNPLRRWGRPEDVAAAVVFLLRSDFITGQVIYVDGGRHMRGQTYG